MKFSKLFLALAAAGSLSFSAQAQILVTASGAGPFDFAVAPPSPANFSTLSVGTLSSTYEMVGPFDTQIMTTVASSVNVALGTSATVPPGAFATARHNTALLLLQTHPTGNDYTLLMATLQNNSGATISSFKLTYDFGVANTPAVETIPGYRVFFSTTGAAGSWQLLPSLSGLSATTAGVNATISGIAWAAGAPAYILWADDNNVVNLDQANTIDNLLISDVVTGGGTVPLAVSLTAPANGTLLFAPGSVTLTASVNGTTPPDSVIFFSNDVEISRDATAPYTAQLTGLAPGTYALYATAFNSMELANSVTNTIRVRNEFVNYTGGILSENFDIMGPTGIEAPVGWYVGAALPATSFAVTPGDGAAGANAAILGWNYGITNTPDRALGTAPTGADRNMVARLRNNTASNITAFAIRYDGELWRNYTNAVDGWLTNFVSYDLGTTWVPTTFDFEQPTPRVEPMGAVDGNAGGNRLANIGGTITPAAPIPPGGVIYIRWQDFNGAGVTDGGLAIDNFTFRGTAFSQALLSVTLTSPTASQIIGAGCAGLANVTASATATAGGANTITNISFQLDGGTATNDSTAPYSVIFSNVALGPHTIMATAKDSSGASISSSVNFSVVVNMAPVMAFTNTYSTNVVGASTGLVFLVGSAIINQYRATDSDGTVTNIDFFLDGVLHYRDTAGFGQVIINDSLPGVHTYTAVAADSCGHLVTNSIVLTVTNPPYALLLTNGSSWRYNDDGLTQAVAWVQLAFNDSGWSNGVAELGFGDVAQDCPEKTLVRRNGGLLDTNNVIYYFRKIINVPNPSAYSDLIVSLLRDDGGVVYINEKPVFTSAQGAYPPIAATADDGTVYFRTNVSSTNLVAGQNIIAVEIRQDNAGSSDISFDLMLWGITNPRLIIAQEGANVRITWSGAGTLQYTDNMSNTPVWTDQGATGLVSPGNYLISRSVVRRFYSLRP